MVNGPRELGRPTVRGDFSQISEEVMERADTLSARGAASTETRRQGLQLAGEEVGARGPIMKGLMFCPWEALWSDRQRPGWPCRFLTAG